MDTEIELKLLVSGDVITLLEQDFLPSLSAHRQVHWQQSEFDLFNQYFDTPDNQLRKHDIGLRVRSKGENREQTVKTSGKIAGGLHQRPEYNVAIKGNRPDLDLFDPTLWPDDLSLSRLQAQLSCIFTTDFTRRQYLLSFADGEVELVFDRGKISANNQHLFICELELELKRGTPDRLFDLALRLAQCMPVRIGILSKAARGYMLAAGKTLSARPIDAYLPVNAEDSCEVAFSKAVEYGLGHWQHHEHCFMQSNKPRDLLGMYDGMRLLLQTLALYLPILQCESLLSLHKALMAHIERWRWLETVLAFKTLRSQKGPYRKRLGRDEELRSYLHGRSEGILTEHQAQKMLVDPQHVSLQLELSRLLNQAPWRQDTHSFSTPLSQHTKGWLSQSWLGILQSMPANKKMAAQDYLSLQVMLRQTLYNGMLIGDTFDDKEARDQFRAPWLDISDGIQELATLTLLQEELHMADIEQRAELLTWSVEKIANLLAVMEQSRQVAISADTYW